jgi:hypothetical protein
MPTLIQPELTSHTKIVDLDPEHLALVAVLRSQYRGKPWGDLGNEIHPIFQTISWNLPAFLKPLFRLASKFLQEDSFFPFWYAIIFSTEEKEFDSQSGCEIRKLPYKDGMTDAEWILTGKALLRTPRYIKHITFGFPSDKPGTTFESNLARTELEAHGASIITLLNDFRTTLNPNTPWPKETVPITEDERLRTGFYLAVMLLHEVTHALHHCRLYLQGEFLNTPSDCSCGRQVDPKIHDPELCKDALRKATLAKYPHGVPLQEQFNLAREPFFDNHDFPELGKSAEIHFFNGFEYGGSEVFNPGQPGQLGCPYKFMRPLDGLTISKWNDDLAAGYGLSYIKPQDGTPFVPCRGTPRKWFTTHIIPMRYIIKVFKRKFWTNDVMLFERQTLRVPKVLGVKWKNKWRWEEGRGWHEFGAMTRVAGRG